MTITDTADTGAARPDESPVPAISAVGGPVRVGWREGVLTRAAELEALGIWAGQEGVQQNTILTNAIQGHLKAARVAACSEDSRGRQRFRLFRNGAHIERATSNLDAAEAFILAIAPTDYVLGQMPCLLKHVQCHLPADDPRRQEFDRIARKLGIKDADHPLLPADQSTLSQQRAVVDDERAKITTIVRGASTEALREHVRLRSFCNIVVATAVVLMLLALGIAIVGWVKPTLIPICFAPEQSDKSVVVVCPTDESAPFVPLTATPQDDIPSRDIDEVVRQTATSADLLVIELVGLTAAAVAAAAAIRSIRGSSERFGLPVALAALKLPTGAITAFLGLLLIRGQFVPGLTALDTPGQIVAWALLFGYAQQLFTRLVDQQGQSVLDSVRGADKPQPAASAT